jgi:hypothetical protein
VVLLTADQALDHSVVEGQPTIGNGLTDDSEYKASVICLCVSVPKAPPQAFLGDVGGQHLKVLRRIVLVTPLEGQEIIYRQPSAVCPSPWSVALVGGQEKAHGIDEPRSLLQQAFTFVN